MPAKSEKQRRLFAAAYAAKEGADVGGQAARIAATTSKKTIREFMKRKKKRRGTGHSES